MMRFSVAEIRPKNDVQNKSNLIIVRFALLLMCIIMLTGCGLFGESDYERTQREFKEKKEQQAEQKKIQNQELAKEYDAIRFPSEQFSPSDYTYEFQQFFNGNKNRNLIFQGTINDVWQENDSVFVEALCPIGELPPLWAEVGMVLEDGIFLRLKASKEDAQYIINDVHRAEFNYDNLSFQDAQQVLIIAQIIEVTRERLFEHSAYGYGEDVDVELETLQNVIANGMLVELQTIKAIR